METARKLEKAKLIAIKWSKTNEIIPDLKNPVVVQFNPSSLKVSYTNKIQTHGESSGSSIQYVGRGSSTLSVDLIFDVSGANATNTRDVRKMTQNIANFMRTTPVGAGEEKKYKVSGVRFQWGTFLFDGILESMNETLELWSEQGRPLRAAVAISLQQPGIHFDILPEGLFDFSLPKGQGGITPMIPAQKGANLQSMTANAGIKTNWKTIAKRNRIENPRHLSPGTLINLQD